MKPAGCKPAGNSFSLIVVVAGWLVTGLHGYLHAVFFTRLGSHLHDESWVFDPRFGMGLGVYAVGLLGILRCEHIVRCLRPSGSTVRYAVPRGFLFEYVTSPQYLCELTAWAGLAVATWSLASVFIFTMSAANLVPRAMKSHTWYQQKFDDYPKQRKVLLPGLW